jgi:hypothetical protein
MNETNTGVIARLDRLNPPSIPETPAIVPRSRGVLDRPVKPGDDSLLVASVLPRPVDDVMEFCK